MPTLTDTQTKLLIKLLGMLGSAFDGERANAAAKANELIRSSGLTWESYILGGRSLREPPSAAQSTPSGFTRRPFDPQSGEPVAIVVTIVHETAKALLVDPGDGPPVWLPKSQIIDQQPTANGKAHLIGIPKWLAEAKGLTTWRDV